LGDGALREAISARTLSIAEIAGFAHPRSAKWGLVRARQVYAARRSSTLGLCGNVLAAAFVAGQLYPTFHAAIVAWLTVLTAVCAALFFRHHRVTPERKTTPIDHHPQLRLLAEAFALGLVWTALPLVFFLPADAVGRLAIVGVVAGVMAASMMTYATLPVVASVFMVPLVLAGWWIADVIAAPLLAVAMAVYAMTLAVGAFGTAQRYIGGCLARAKVADQNETIALLLHDLDEAEGDWLWQTDRDGRIERVSDRMARHFGVRPAILEGAALLSLIDYDVAGGPAARAAMIIASAAAARRAFVDVVMPVARDGQPRWLRLSAKPMVDAHGAFLGYRGVGADITELRRSEERMAYMAQYDALTGLPNRTMVHDALARAQRAAVRSGRPATLMLFDLDRFKLVNDTFGHAVGDALLREVAARVGALLGAAHLFGRVGGDEFAVVVDRDAVTDPLPLARAIIAAVSDPYHIDGHMPAIGASIGMASGPRDGSTVDMLIRNADLALYHAKEAGRGKAAQFDYAMLERAEERRTLEIELRAALDRDQLTLVFQPIMTSDGTRIQAFEALLRWHHPTLGEIEPARFVPVAEEAGLIVAIGEWVLRSACAQARDWPADVNVAVNLSPQQFASPALPATVVNAVAASGIAPDRLELELTASVLADDTPLADGILTQLAGIGVHIVLDDFGSGPFSLAHLRKTRFAALKIDRDVVRGVRLGHDHDVAVAGAVVALANGLGIATTAKGIERADDLPVVRALGCSRVQGFHVGAPLAADAARMLVSGPTDERLRA